MKLDLLTNATVVDDVIRLTAEYSKKLKLKLSSSYEEEEENSYGMRKKSI